MNDGATDRSLVPLVVTSILLSGLLAFLWIQLGRQSASPPELSSLPGGALPSSVPVWSVRPRDGVRVFLFPTGQEPALHDFRNVSLAPRAGAAPGGVTFADWVVVNESDRAFEVDAASWGLRVAARGDEFRSVAPVADEGRTAATRLVLDSLGHRLGPYLVPSGHVGRFVIAFPSDLPSPGEWEGVRWISPTGPIALHSRIVDRRALLDFRLDPTVGLPDTRSTEVARRPTDEVPSEGGPESPDASPRR